MPRGKVRYITNEMECWLRELRENNKLSIAQAQRETVFRAKVGSSLMRNDIFGLIPRYEPPKRKGGKRWR